MENKYKINTPWNLWTHSLDNNEWNKESYSKILSIKKLYDYIYISSIINDSELINNMFFLMRNEILPMWECDDNKNGCTYSFKVPFKHIKEEWDKLLFNCISEKINRNIDEFNNITGISVVPKKSFNIIKIWFRNSNISLSNNIITYKPFIHESNSIKKIN